MTSNFSDRLKTKITPILDAVSNREDEIKSEQRQRQEAEGKRRERHAANRLRAESFYRTCVERIAGEIATELNAESKQFDFGGIKKLCSVISIPRKTKLVGVCKCEMEIEIHCTSDAFGVTIRANAGGQTPFMREESYPASDFNRDIALEWVESNAIEAASYVAENNQPG